MIFINLYIKMAKQVNDKIYYDLDALMNFVFVDDGMRTNDVEITTTQGKNEATGDMEIKSKIIREVKANNNNKQAFRYDMLKMFMETLDNVEVENEVVPLSLGQQVILNTMGAYGLIKQIEE